MIFEEPHKRHQHGNHFVLKIEIGLPGKDIAITRDPAEHTSHEDPYSTVTEAFDVAKRQVSEYVRKRRGD